MGTSQETTDLVLQAVRGDPSSEEELIARIYGDLRQLARREIGRWEDPTFDSAALVHELYLRLLRRNKTQWMGRRHLLNAFAQAMHLFMIDAHRRRVVQGVSDTELRGLEDPSSGFDAVDLVALRESLADLATAARRAAEILRARFFLGLTVEEIAREFDVSVPTVERDLAYARAWLHRRLMR